MSTKNSGFWIPREVYLCRELTMLEKFVYVEIKALSMLDKGCIASNSHFAEVLGIAIPNASRAISSLASKGYISIKPGRRNIGRKITIIKTITQGYQNDNTPYQNDNLPLSKRLESKENNTGNNTKSNTLSLDEKKKCLSEEWAKAGIEELKYPKEMVKEFTEYWFEPTKDGKKIRYDREKTWDTKARLRRWYRGSVWEKEDKKLDAELKGWS